jgi:hypothetical protein
MPHLATQPSRLGFCGEHRGDSCPLGEGAFWIVLVVADVVRLETLARVWCSHGSWLISPGTGSWAVPALRAGVVVRSPLDEGLRVTLRRIGARLLNGERKARAHLVSTVTIWVSDRTVCRWGPKE